MHVVITGATGNIGTGLLDALADDPTVTRVTGLARRPPERATWPATTFVACDITTDDLAPLLVGADVVVHLAWLFQPTHRPTVTWAANALGSRRVFEAAARSGVGALVHSSSVGAYSPGPPDGRPVDESWPTDSLPTCAYGREKAYAERVLDTMEEAHPDLRVVRLRPGFVFSRPPATSQRRLFAGPLLPRQLVRPGRLPLVPYPEGLRFQALHTRDVADAFRRAATTDVRGPFNVAAEPVIDGPTFAEVLGGRPVAVPRSLVRAALAPAWWAHLLPTEPALFDLFMELPVMDTSRARDELGWRASTSATDALHEVLVGMADGAGGPTPHLEGDTVSGRVRELATGIGQRP